MAYDANLILRGQYSSAYVDLDANDAEATSLTVNSDGNVCVDLGNTGTGAKGLDCIVILHDVPTTYADTCDIIIEDSDHLLGTTANRGWQSVLSFPRLYCYLREVIVTATTAFTAAGDFAQVLADTGTSAGVIRQFSRNLLTVGGTGKVFIEMQTSADTYPTDGDTLTSVGGGVGTQIGTGRVIDTPLILVRRFSTSKRYIRSFCTVSASGNFGDVDILVTDSQHSHVNNLLM